jgi:hypothetical protein
MTITVAAKLGLANGQLIVTGIEDDVDVDNVDALACTLLSGLLGPFGLITNTVVMGIVDTINPTHADKTHPSVLEPVLPGTEFQFRTALSHLEIEEGFLVLSGVASVIPNDKDWFLYLRVLETEGPSGGVGLERFPVANATVALFELDDPPPAGDDASLPEVEEEDTFSGDRETTVTRNFARRADEWLDTGTTDENGLVRFRVRPNGSAGTLTTYRTTSNVETGKVISQSTSHQSIAEPAPDFAVTITAPDGTVLTVRQLIALNAGGHRVGSIANPLPVVVVRQRLVLTLG